LVLLALGSGACGATAVDATLPARCSSRADAVAVAGSTMPPLTELARFPVAGDPHFVASGETVYWVTYGAAPSLFIGPTTISGHALALGETTPKTLWTQISDGNRALVGRLWASGPDLAWLEFFPSKPPTNGALYVSPQAGGAMKVLVDRLRVTDLNGGMRLLGTDDQRLYISPISPVGISAVVRATGEMTPAIATATPPTLLAVEGDSLTWVAGNELWRARRDGSGAALLASGVKGALALAVQDGVAWVIVGEGPQQRLARVASATCAVVSAWSEAGRDAQVVADASGLYVALSALNGDAASTVWWVRPDGRASGRLLAPEVGRLARLLAARPDGLLLAVSLPMDAWAIARLPHL
jgi:hypothetical protein